MSVIINQLSTLITILSSDLVNTGNRLIDNSIIAIVTFIFIQGITILSTNWKSIYNRIIFYLYNMKENPMNILDVPYIYTIKYTSYDKLVTDFKSAYIVNLFWNHQEIYKVIYSNTNETNFMIQVFEKYTNTNRMNFPITDLNGYVLKNQNENKTSHTFKLKNESGTYLLTIDNQGYPIYYSTSWDMFFHNRDSMVFFQTNVMPILINEFYNIKNKDKKNVKNGIYIIKKCDLQLAGYISPNKTFDTLFYTQKEELMHILNKFRLGKMYPSHVPMDNKLGIMLYGPPGTGKTGTISAIANFLGRNITIINFSEISSTDDFDTIFNHNRYNETIFVFDEFDYLLDVLGSNKDKDSNEMDWGKILMVAEGEERKQILESIRQNTQQLKKNISVSYLLQKLDGLESSDGRVIIATTNNPDKINPALMRPGRFDLKLCLGNCTQDMYGKILENFYKDEKNVYDRVTDAKIPSLKYSPLEIINLAMQSETLDILLEKIFHQYKFENTNTQLQ